MTQPNMNLPPSVASTLESLLKRPNVQSTLILSRVDGSVINITGSLAEGQTGTARAPENKESEGITNVGLAPAEDLAVSIFHFVSAANTLGITMEPILAEKSTRLHMATLAEEESYVARRGLAKKDTDTATDRKVEGGDVQLLRMRTKKHEIIVYPDAKFLCCVIQAVPRSGHANGDAAG